MTAAPASRPLVRTAREAADLCAPRLAGRGAATLVVLHLDRERRMIRLCERSSAADGGLPSRAILADAIRCDAAGLVLACRGKARIAPIRELARSAATLGITLHDHLVFDGRECRSLRAFGLI